MQCTFIAEYCIMIEFKYHLIFGVLTAILTTLYLTMQPTDGHGPQTSTLGREVLLTRGIFDRGYWYWLGLCVLFGYSILFNLLFCFFLKVLNRKFIQLRATGLHLLCQGVKTIFYWSVGLLLIYPPAKL